MTTYVVTRKDTGAEVYRYLADAPIEWVGFEFATHNHTAAPDEVVAPVEHPPQVWDPLGFLRRLTVQERIAARTAAKTDPVVADFMDLLDKAKLVHNTDPDLRAGVGYLVAIGALTAARRDEVLYG